MKISDKQEGPGELAARPLQFPASAGHCGRVSGRQSDPLDLRPQRSDAVRLCVARRDAGAQLDLALSIEPVDPRRTHGRHELHEAVEAHQTASGPRHIEARDRLRVAAILGRQPQLDVVVIVHLRVAEARDPLVATDHQSQRAGDLCGVDAEVGRTRAVDARLQLGPVELQRGHRVHETQRFGAAAELLGEPRQFIQIGASQDEVDVPARPAETERLDVANRRVQIAEPAQLRAHRLHHVPLGVVVVEGLLRLQPDESAEQPAEREDALFVRRNPHVQLPLVHRAEEGAADAGHDQTHPRDRAHFLLDRLHRLTHRGETRSLRCHQPDLELRFVDVAGGVFLLDHRIQRERRQRDR